MLELAHLQFGVVSLGEFAQSCKNCPRFLEPAQATQGVHEKKTRLAVVGRVRRRCLQERERGVMIAALMLD